MVLLDLGDDVMAGAEWHHRGDDESEGHQGGAARRRCFRRLAVCGGDGR